MSTHAYKTSRLRLLSPGQRRLLLFVLGGAILLLANSAYLVLAAHSAGIGDDPHHLPVTYQAMLVLHVGVGVIVFLPAVFFAFWHLKRARYRRTPGTVPTGAIVLFLAIFLFVSGFFILSAANTRGNLWAFVGHQVAAVLLPLMYLVHRLLSKDRPTRATALRTAGVFAALLGIFWLCHAIEVEASPTLRPGARPRAAPEVPEVWRNPPINDPFVPFVPAAYVDPKSPFFPSATTTTTGGFLPARIIHHDDFPDREAYEAETRERGFAPSYYLGAQTCVRCHQDIVEQWATSAHRFASFNNPFYRAAVELTRETRGNEVSQWCGGCHDPAIMLAGNMTKEIDPITMEAQAGLTCLACHAIDEIHNQTGNGNYNIQDEVPSPYVFDDAKVGPGRILHDYVLKAKPLVHKQQMLKPFFRTSEFCATCHKVNLDVPVNGYRWIRGQNDYDAWHNSGVPHNNPMTWYEPPETKTCHDCHMPLEDAPLGDVAAKNGKVRSHRFLAVNTALPHLRGDQDTIDRMEAFLRDQKLKVDIFALHREDGTRILGLESEKASVRPGEWIQVDVVVRNLGVGHTFPAGTNDSNEGWIDFRVHSGEELVWQSGRIRDDGQVDPAAHFYQAVLVDKNSQRISRRNPADIHATIYVNVIPPSGSDIARYRFRVPSDASKETLTIRAALNWRKFNRTYTEFVFEGKEVPDLPVTVIAATELELRTTLSQDDGDFAPLPKAEDWTRFNDYGIGSLLDGDTRSALAAFRMVAELVPEKVDGWRNQARAFLADGSLGKAEDMMRRASALLKDKPAMARDDARNAFFWGRILAESGRLELAIHAYQRTLQAYPQSRDAWGELGQTFWRLGRYEDSINAFVEVLRIDPEHAFAHHQRSLAYKALATAEQDPKRKAAFAYAATEAERAFDKYRIDEDAQALTLEYRLAHPHDNRMSQSIVVHEQESP